MSVLRIRKPPRRTHAEEDLNRLRRAGYSEQEIAAYRIRERKLLKKAGFSEDEVNTYFGKKEFDDSHIRAWLERNEGLDRSIVRANKAAERASSGDEQPAMGSFLGPFTPPSKTQPLSQADLDRVWEEAFSEETLSDAFRIGWQNSVMGLHLRRKLPDDMLRNSIFDSSLHRFSRRTVANVGTLTGDLPAIIAGFGAGLSSGNPVVATGSSFALPAYLRQIAIEKYENGEIDSAYEFAERTGRIMWETGKGFTEGVAMGTAGKTVEAIKMPGISAGMKRSLQLGAEISTMVSLGAALEGRLPEPHEFLDAAIVIGGIHGSQHIAAKLRNIYVDTGRPPGWVASLALKDPVLREFLVASSEKTPEELESVAQPLESKQNNVSPEGFEGEVVIRQRERESRFAELNLSEEQKEGVRELVRDRYDDVTGFLEREYRKPTAKRALAHVNKSGEAAHYIEGDIQNLSGLNAKYTWEKANDYFAGMTSIFREELERLGGHLSLFKHGGDEISAIIVGVKGEEVDAALQSVSERVMVYVRENGLTDVPPSKESRGAGTGLYLTRSEFKQGDDINAVFARAQNRLEANKIVRKNKTLFDGEKNGRIITKEKTDVNRFETGKVGVAPPEGQAGGVAQGAQRKILDSGGGEQSQNRGIFESEKEETRLEDLASPFSSKDKFTRRNVESPGTGESTPAKQSGIAAPSTQKPDASVRTGKDGGENYSRIEITVEELPDVKLATVEGKSKIERGFNLISQMPVLQAESLYDPKNVSIGEAIKIGWKFFKKYLMPAKIHCPAFYGYDVDFRSRGWEHLTDERRPEADRKFRISLLPKARAVVENAHYAYEIRRGLAGNLRYALIGRFDDGSVIRVIVEETKEGGRTFLSVFDWKDVTKKMRQTPPPGLTSPGAFRVGGVPVALQATDSLANNPGSGKKKGGKKPKPD